jgi:hypothetical protein
MHAYKLLTALSVVVMGTSGVHAIAPASVAGKVYHESGVNASLRRTWNHSVSLRPDGTYRFIYYSTGSTLDNTSRRWGQLERTPNDGTYRYRKSSETTGVLIFEDPTGTIPARGVAPQSVATLELDFSPPGNLPASERRGFVSAAQGGGGFYLTEWSDSDALVPLLNASMRTQVTPGKPVIVGFVTSEPFGCDVLIRVVGPGLTAFGLAGVWSDPEFELVAAGRAHPQAGVFLGDWSTEAAATEGLRRVFGAVGAFPLETGSRDAVGLMRLKSGAHSVVCLPREGSSGGEALIEVYLLP